MGKKSTTSALLLFITALIWGLAFVAQSEGMKTLGTYTFFALRSLLALLFLLGVSAVKKIRNKALVENKTNAQSKKHLIIAGAICGTAMFIATIAQQNGLLYTTVGKSGFITALYILLVPVFGLFLRKKVAPFMWFCVAVAIGGMYLLCVSESSGINKGDFYTLISAAFYAVQILTIDIYISKVDAVKLSLTQLGVGFLLSSIFMFIFEEPTIAQIQGAIIPILYVGIFSSGIAYTLQITAQKNISPTVSALIMSFESVFAAIFGWIILSESLSAREIFGCCLMFLAIILSELPVERVTIIKNKLKLDKTQGADV
ncbi:MAG TPA: DMT family transporter [Oscillospiraceae bacterium]|nr:DMT family transporter [Oscillospiraceae bacterium]